MKNEFTIKKIARIENGFNEKFGVPRQSGLAPSVKSYIIFEKEFRDENMLRGIEEYSHLWLIWGFSENNGEWFPTVRPPKLGGNKRVGVFASRSPFRPNSLGLTLVKLEKVEKTENGKVLLVSGADLKDGTPLFDIKPYLPYVESVESAKGSFSEEHKNDFWNVDFEDDLSDVLTENEKNEIVEILSLNPVPAYKNDCERIYGISYKNFNVKFKICNGTVTVTGIEVANENF